MAIYKKVNSLGGAWVKKSELTDGSIAKIVSETNPEPSNFKNSDGTVKIRNVCKVKFADQDAVNVELNRATVNGLVDAFGEDSKDWQGHTLTVKTENGRMGGKAIISLYLIPPGYKMINDENGYAVIVSNKAAKEVKDSEIPVINAEEDKVNAELAGEDSDESSVNLKDIPFN